MTTSPNELADRVGRVIDIELTRLRHRQPTLTASQLAVVEQTLSDLANRLLLDAIRRNPRLWPRLELLFTDRLRSRYIDHAGSRRE